MSSYLDKIEASVRCPKCGRVKKYKLKTLKAKTDYKCSCGQCIALNAKGVADEIKVAEKAIDGIFAPLKKLK